MWFSDTHIYNDCTRGTRRTRKVFQTTLQVFLYSRDWFVMVYYDVHNIDVPRENNYLSEQHHEVDNIYCNHNP